MTIDEAKDHLYTYSSTLGSGQTTQAQHEEAKKVAIDIMHKYQKIIQIMEDCQRYPLDCLFDVRKVLEDGNDD